MAIAVRHSTHKLQPFKNEVFTQRNTQREEAMSELSGSGKTVCVTGASGFIASWLVLRLLQRGYTVKATVRDPNDPDKTKHLLALDGAKERLHLFKADLLEEGSFDSVLSGCEGVFHTACPVVLESDDTHRKEELVEPALKGTLNVLKSCLKEPCLKRVILTSSMASVVFSERPLNPDTAVDETWFSNPLILEQMKLWYPLGKTLAEDAAWKFAEQNQIDLVTIHPSFVIGPLLQPTLNATVEVILNLVNGAQAYPDGYYHSVDVRDVADVHVQVFEISSASGRYCFNGSSVHFSEVLDIVRRNYPSLKLPEETYESIYFRKATISEEKLKTLGVSFTPLEVTLKDTIECLKEKGFLNN